MARWPSTISSAVNSFTGADLSAKLKLLGGRAGSAMPTAARRAPVATSISTKAKKRLIVSADNKTLLGAVLVGDTSDYGNLLQLVLNAIELPENPDSLILRPTPAAASHRSAWINCRTARRSAPALTSAKAT